MQSLWTKVWCAGAKVCGLGCRRTKTDTLRKENFLLGSWRKKTMKEMKFIILKLNFKGLLWYQKSRVEGRIHFMWMNHKSWVLVCGTWGRSSLDGSKVWGLFSETKESIQWQLCWKSLNTKQRNFSVYYLEEACLWVEYFHGVFDIS